MSKEIYVDLAQVYDICEKQANLIAKEFKPDIMLGIDIRVTRIMRKLLNISFVYARVYPEDDPSEWLNDSIKAQLNGKRVLVVDQADDTRYTLSYATHALLETCSPAAVAVMVLHNKNKKKEAELPSEVKHYYAGAVVDDVWLQYFWGN
jgi:hypoxanthine phosphoribosyltransferase